jgi:hypothetical protein
MPEEKRAYSETDGNPGAVPVTVERVAIAVALALVIGLVVAGVLHFLPRWPLRASVQFHHARNAA